MKDSAASGSAARVALLPEPAGRVRRRVTYLDLTHVHDVAESLEAVPAGSVVIVDSVDLVGTKREKAALTALVERTRVEGPVVLGAASEDHLRDFAVDGTFAAPASTREESRV